MKIDIITVKTIGTLREGTSKTTGNPWKALEVLIEWPDGEYYQRQVGVLYGEQAAAFIAAGIHEGDNISADVQLTTEAHGSWVHNKTILRNPARQPF